jgi:pimeloyl-ACP methyl ester carboxylesterase
MAARRQSGDAPAGDPDVRRAECRLRSLVLRSAGKALRAAAPRGSVGLRGRGESDKPQGANPISAYTDDIAFLIGALRLGKVVGAGHFNMMETPDRVNSMIAAFLRHQV